MKMEKNPKDANLLVRCRKSVLSFFEEQKEFKQAQTKHEELKTKFYSDMEELFDSEKIDKSCSFSYSYYADSELNLEVNKVQKSSVIFDADKLEKTLSKEICKDVIIKRYEVNDMFGLIAYLKEHNVDPKVFKSFLTITKSVDVKELERLEELGKITVEQLKGCYLVKKQKPYFTVGIKKWRGEND